MVVNVQKYVTINWWEGNDGLEVPVHVVRYGWMYRRHQVEGRRHE